MKNDFDIWGTLVWLIPLVMFFVSIAAWITHIVTCLSEGKYGFLIAGALAFPIAVVHGFGIWFGFWH